MGPGKEETVQVLAMLNREVPEIADVLIKHNLCPECKGPLERHDEEIVCIECGYTPENSRFSLEIPFNAGTKPGNKLDHGNGYGQSLQRKGLFCTLAHGNNNVTYRCPQCGYESDDMPLRAMQVSLITEKYEHPKILTLLTLGRKLSEDYGFGDRKSRKGVEFSNYYGNVLRKLGSFIIVRNMRANLTKVARAAFVYSVQKLCDEEQFLDATRKLQVEPVAIHAVATTFEELI